MIKKETLLKIQHAIFCLFVFSLPISIAATNIFGELFFLLLIFQKRTWQTFKQIAWHQFAIVRWSVLLFLFMLIAIVYSNFDWLNIGKQLEAYRRLLFIPVMIIYALHYPNIAQKAFNGLYIAVFITLIFSFINYFFPLPSWISLSSEHKVFYTDSYVFKNHISQNVFMCLLVIMSLKYTIIEKTNLKWFYFVLALIATFNILFMVHGRTAYIPVVCVWFFWLWFLPYTKIKVVMFATLTLAFIAVMQTSFMQSKIAKVTNAIENYQQNYTFASSTMRLAYWQTSLKIIEQNPVLGCGTGCYQSSFSKYAFPELKQNARVFSVGYENPHNQFLYVAVQWGIVGLCLLLAMIFSIFQRFKHSNRYDKFVTLSFFVLFMVHAMLDRALFTSVECYFYGVIFVMLCINQYHSSNPSFNKSFTKEQL